MRAIFLSSFALLVLVSLAAFPTPTFGEDETKAPAIEIVPGPEAPTGPFADKPSVVALFEIRKLKTEGKLEEYEKALIGYKDKFMEQQLVYLELAAFYKEKGDKANCDLYLKKVDTLEHGGGGKCSDPSLLSIPGTLEILASLIELNPGSFRMNHYIAQTYIAYGYPDLAIKHVDAHKDAYAGREPMNYWGKLLGIGTMYCDMEGINKLATRCETMFKCHNNSPDGILNLMNFRSSVVSGLYEYKRYEMAIERADADLARFAEEAKKMENHEVFTAEGARPTELVIYKGVRVPMAKLMHLQTRARALVALKKMEGLYDPFTQMLADADKVEIPEGELGREMPWHLKARVYHSASEVARAAGDEKLAEEYMKKGEEARQKAREIMHERPRGPKPEENPK